MANAKKYKQGKILDITLFLFLVLFPFGVLLDYEVGFGIFKLSVRPIDLVALFALTLVIFRWVVFKKYSLYFIPFIFAALFSLLISFTFFPTNEVFVGFFYLVRFISYLSIFVLTAHSIHENPNMKKMLLTSLITVSFFVAIYGFIQYFWLPDLRFLLFLGWDDHLFRLVSTFLDPAFTGLVLVLGSLGSLALIIRGRTPIQIFVFIVLVVATALTYSRASYLTFAIGVLYFLFKKRTKLVLISVLLSFLLFIPFLPRPSSDGVKLERTHSIFAKMQNYQETFKIFSAYPVFGVGFNNLCSARIRVFGDSVLSHSCYGSDSSLLFIMATTGVVGLIIFISSFVALFKDISGNIYGDVWKVSVLSIFIHSQFVGSLFYPWVVGYLAILTAVAIAGKAKD